ncbi:hypothetical protein CPB83DRAFT_772202 [Crepidotus variabilis]|uniref:C2H2-type domain-containing protein n=1 Tax=Crepidotus variabilis TaxID=179855 RepID=A0A9P6E9N5_9AGAR|nr:hypothetical protein CPB83DRAFT_772202 [Crepidotus variabilis]
MEPVSSYPSDSPSPPNISEHHLLPQNSPDNSQNPFLHSVLPNYTPEVSLPQDRVSNKYGATSNNTNSLPLIEQRRMSEPAALSGPALYATPSVGQHSSSSGSRYIHNDTPFAFDPHVLPPRPSSLYPGHLHRGASTGSLRDLRHHHSEYHPHSSQRQSEWKPESQLSAFQQNLTDNRADGFDEPISPLQPNFSGVLTGSPTSGMPYSPGSEHPYGPSPPGTGTSTSSSIAPLSAGPGMPCSPSLSINQHLHRSLSNPNVGTDPSIDRKTYSFVALPGNAVKKRPRRRYDEIERLYQCSWPDCSKSYGTLNHLNAHVTMQKHGSKRTPDEFKDMRKQWRKAKKEQAAAAVSMRRDSYADLYEDHAAYDPRYLTHHSQHPSRGHGMHDGLGLPASVNIGMTDRYTVPVEEIRYPPSHERDDGNGVYEPMSARQRYMNGVPASWHGGSALSRSNLMHHQQRQQDVYGSVSGSSMTQQQPAHHSQLPQLAIGSRIPGSSPHSAPAHSHEQNTAMHGHRGLPQNSTLLTPLSGYHSSSLVPTMSSGGGAGNVMYTSEGYEVYDSDSTGRPGTGHTNFSVSQTSVDEFDPHSQ